MKDRFVRIEELFNRAVEIGPEERDAFLDQECGDDTGLRREVEKLLESAGRTGDFLEIPVFARLNRVADDEERLDLAREFIGRRVGAYLIESLIGIGGMAAVYRGRSLALGRSVAIKVPFRNQSCDEKGMRRFRREARAAAALNHPGIAQVYEFLEDGGVQYIVMEYVEGRTLASIIREAPLKTANAVRIAVQILRALAAAHRLGIIHRDIKSSNIVVRPDGVAKVLDFGLAKVQNSTEAGVFLDLSSTSLTVPGTLLGTAAYLSPEQVRQDPVDQRTDLFSFGVVLYEMVTGLLPFQGKTIADTFDRICWSNPLPIGRVNPEASEKLEPIIRKCLNKDPGLRYQSAAEILIELGDEAADRGQTRPSWWARLIRRVSPSRG